MGLRYQTLIPCFAAMAVIGGSFYLVAREADLQSNSNSNPNPVQHVNSGEAYEGVPEPLSPGSSKLRTGTVCPVCENSDGTQSHQHVCQLYNLKQDHMYEGIEVRENRWIRMACEEAVLSVKDGGGPFGAVIVQIDNDSDQVIRYWRTRNLVTKTLDPTAHAEVNAVRAVAGELGVINLGAIHSDDPQLKLPQPGEVSRCEIYSSCEPCPMCYSAIRWARIDTVVFAATRYDAAEPGVDFSDLALYDELATSYKNRQKHGLRVFQATTSNALDAFNLWKNTDKIAY